jgi:hypothetical protein
MKHLYLLLAVCLYCTITTNAQTKYWIGASGANWNDASNWSNTDGGAPGADVPNGTTYNTIFMHDALVNVNITSVNLNSITVTNNAKVRLYTPTLGSIMTLFSTNPAAPGIKVDLGSTLEDSCSTPATEFVTRFANNSQGTIDGTWTFLGTPPVPGPPALGAGNAYPRFPVVTTYTNLVKVTGTIKLGNDGYFDCKVPAYLSFESGSQFWIARDGGIVPAATWNTNSTLLLTGIKTGGPSYAISTSAPDMGNIVINCPNIASLGIPLSLPNNLVIKGNLQVQNTNNINLGLSGSTGASPINYTIGGNLELGGTSYLTLGGTNTGYTYGLQVNGHFIQTDGVFNLRNNIGTVTQPTVLRVKGDILQLGGSFTCANTTVSTADELFVLELNGTAAQAITSAGSIDNATNQVTLRLNNASGATLATSLSVGKISWSSANKGHLTTSSTNVLTIRNTNVSDALVVNGASNVGYINGPVQRNTASIQYYKFPTGKGGVLRECEVKPSATTPSTYEAEYFGTAHSSTAKQLPLTGFSKQEYWNIGKIAGSDAQVRLTLAGAIPLTVASDTLVVAHFTGGTWTDARGTKLNPGNSSSGSVESQLLTSFSPFTFGIIADVATLPIYLLNFTARKDGATAKLNWSITDNSTPQKFEVLRSTNGSNFTPIGTVTGVERKLNYDFTDQALPNGTVYYRLRMIDIDGSGELTKIVAIMNGNKGVVITSMMPTLVTNRARLNITSSEKTGLQLVVTDIYGRSVKQQLHTLTNGNQEIWLNLATLPAGTYQVTGYLQNGEKTSSIRFIKQ